MRDHIHALQQTGEEQIRAALHPDQVDQVIKSLLGKEGPLQKILKGLKDLSDGERKEVGAAANTLKQGLLAVADERIRELQRFAVEEAISNSTFDPTLPGRPTLKLKEKGGVSPFTAFERRAVRAFEKLGFTVWDGEHVVSDFQNFGALNFPDDHPAREMHDTFYVEQGYVLRTHTSTLQRKILSESTFPIRAVVPGFCFRNEATDARHEVMFTQLEGVVVDHGITVSHLIGTLNHFLSDVFEREVKTRIRPGYFPFVEPGLELEMHCLICEGKGCKLCKGLGWLEVMPCGMIHPAVLRGAGVDPTVYSGFAFGFGMSRLTQLLYTIEDCRLMFSDHPDYLRQCR